MCYPQAPYQYVIWSLLVAVFAEVRFEIPITAVAIETFYSTTRWKAMITSHSQEDNQLCKHHVALNDAWYPQATPPHAAYISRPKQKFCRHHSLSRTHFLHLNLCVCVCVYIYRTTPKSNSRPFAWPWIDSLRTLIESLASDMKNSFTFFFLIINKFFCFTIKKIVKKRKIQETISQNQRRKWKLQIHS